VNIKNSFDEYSYPAVCERITSFFILLLIFITYLPCLRASFVNWDDEVHLSASHSQMWTSTVNNTYIPLTTSTWAIEHYFFGYNPFVFHLDNILLHLFVTALVIVFSQRMGLTPLAAALAGLLFGIHPMHVESVAWVTERKDVLYGTFYMSALLMYLNYIDTNRRKYFWFTMALGVLSICAKPMAVSLPLSLLVLDWFRQHKMSIRLIFDKLLCASFLVPIAFVTYFLNSHIVEPAMGQGFFIWAWCFVFYLYKFFYPWPLILFYGLPASGTIFYLATVALIGLLTVGFVFRRNRLLIFALAFYFVNIFFLLRFQPFLSLVSDRMMYLPSVGICIFLAVAVEKILIWARPKGWEASFSKVVLGLGIAVMAAMTWRQCEVWESSETLWRHQLKYDSGTATRLIDSKLTESYLEAIDSSRADSFLRRGW